MPLNSYPNDPNNPNDFPPLEDLQPKPPPYQYYPGMSTYQSQPGVPDAVPPPQYEYGVPPAQVARSAPQAHGRDRAYTIAKLMDYLQWLLLTLEMLFLLRFGLKLLGADPTNPFAVFLYNLTGFFLAPFEGLIPSTPLGTKGVAVIEWSTLVAMAVYALLFYLVRLLLYITISKPQEPIE